MNTFYYWLNKWFLSYFTNKLIVASSTTFRLLLAYLQQGSYKQTVSFSFFYYFKFIIKGDSQFSELIHFRVNFYISMQTILILFITYCIFNKNKIECNEIIPVMFYITLPIIFSCRYSNSYINLVLCWSS